MKESNCALQVKLLPQAVGGVLLLATMVEGV